MRRLFPLLAVVATVGALVALGGGYLVFVRPLRTLPRPVAAIDADWRDVASRLPPLPRADPVDPELLTLVDRFIDDGRRADTTDELARWLRRHDLPDPGCALLEPAPTGLGTLRWFEVGKGLAAEHERLRVRTLADDLHDRELVGLMVAQVLLADTFQRALSTEHVLDAARREVRCTDAYLDQLVQDVDPTGRTREATWPVDPRREQWVYRDRMARMLLAMESAPSRAAMVASLEPFTTSDVPAPVADLLTTSVAETLVRALALPQPDATRDAASE